MSAFTPGPWSVVIGITDETAICSVWPVPSWKPLQVKAQCRVDSDDAEANARLIAAAPDLLAALERTLNWLASYPGECTMGPNGPYEQARAAIAKATGAQS